MLPRKMKRSTVYVIIGALVVYLGVMAYIGRDMLLVENRAWAYFGTIAVEIAVIVALYFILMRRTH